MYSFLLKHENIQFMEKRHKQRDLTINPLTIDVKN